MLLFCVNVGTVGEGEWPLLGLVLGARVEIKHFPSELNPGSYAASEIILDRSHSAFHKWDEVALSQKIFPSKLV